MISPLVSSSTICRRSVRSARLPDTGFLFAGGSNQAFTLCPLARELTRPADCFGFFSGRFLRWFFVEPSTLHLAEDAFPLHLPFQHPESLVDIVVADQYLQEMFPSACFKTRHRFAGWVDEDGLALYCMGAIDSLQVRLLARDLGQGFGLGVVARAVESALHKHPQRCGSAASPPGELALANFPAG